MWPKMNILSRLLNTVMPISYRKSVVRECVASIREASVSIEGSYHGLRNKVTPKTEIQFICDTIEQNRKIGAALKILREVGL